MSPIRLAVLLSGSGTTLQNLIDRIADGRLTARIVQVIANNRNAFGLQRAAQADIAADVVTRQQTGSLDAFSQRIFDLVESAQADLVCLAGFMTFLPIPPRFTNRVMNIHPSLIPAFCGKGMYGHHVHEAVLNYGVKVTGCTVHFADNEYDHGPVILQRAVPVREDDTPASLQQRVFAAECEAYPEAIRLFAEARLRLEGRRVRVLPGRG